MLRMNPAFSVVAILTLGLGIGATTAIFTVFNAILLRPLPYPEPERLAYIRGTTYGPFSTAREYVAWKNRSTTLAQIAAYMDTGANLAGVAEPERVNCGVVTQSLMTMLGARPVIGRSITPEEDRPGGVPVVMLSFAAWQKHFGGSATALGRNVTLDGVSHTIVGVLPATFHVPDEYRLSYDFWIPFAINELDVKSVKFPLLRVIGRLKSGVSFVTAQAELDTIMQSVLRKGIQRHAVVSQWQEAIVGKAKLSLLVFLAAVALVLMIACANLANLMLARSATRGREISVRQALGAGRGRIVRQLLTESLLIGMLGSAAGLMLAYWGKDLLIAFLSENLPTMAPIGIDRRVLAFNLGLAVLTGLAFGLAPAIKGSTVQLSEALKEGGRSTREGRGAVRLRHILVVTEIALAFVLTVGAGLLVRTFLKLRAVDPALKSDHTLSLTINLTTSKYRKPQEQTRFYQDVLEKLQAIPGVKLVSASTSLHLMGPAGTVTGAKLEGRSEPAERFAMTTVSAGFFAMQRIPLKRGRLLSDADREGTPSVAIVNEAFANRYFPGEDCLGRRIESWTRKGDWLTIVGVTGNTRQSVYDRNAEPEVFLPYLQDGGPYMNILVATEGNPATLAAAARERIASVDREQPPYGIMTLDQALAKSVAPRRVNMLLLGSFAGLALVLAAVGIFGVVSYSISQRTREIGIRIALGAEPGNIFALIVGKTLVLAVAGVIFGTAAALGTTRLISSLLFEVGTTDAVSFTAVPILMIGVAVIASYLPARRALDIDPMNVLRHE